jgi:hypothetical protein
MRREISRARGRGNGDFMAEIIKFPPFGGRIPTHPVYLAEAARIVILPVVRIEQPGNALISPFARRRVQHELQKLREALKTDAPDCLLNSEDVNRS